MKGAQRKQTVLRLRVEPSWQPGTRLELFRPLEGPERDRWFLGIFDDRDYSDDPGTEPGPEPAAVPVSNSVIDRIEALLTGVTLTLQPDAILGEDGTDYHLELTGFGVRAKFAWWQQPPAEWQPLSELVELLVELAGPACRLYRDRYE